MEQLLFELEEFRMMLETDCLYLNHGEQTVYDKEFVLRMLNNYKTDLNDILKKYHSPKETL